MKPFDEDIETLIATDGTLCPQCGAWDVRQYDEEHAICPHCGHVCSEEPPPPPDPLEAIIQSYTDCEICRFAAVDPRDYHDFSQQHACPHPTREMRKKPYTRLGKPYYQVRYQCLVCGDDVHNPLGLRGAVILPLPLHDESRSLRWEEALWAHFTDVHAARREQAQRSEAAKLSQQEQAWWAWYTAYLQTPTWRQKRHKVFQRARGRCEGCGEASATQVHHLTYDHVGNELLFELVAICEGCHTRIHREKHHE
jgi:5-methylcytosine-specific restriction endonuclease McrA